MDFDIIKKNKPKLINDDILEKVILNKKNTAEIKYESTILDRIGTRIKNSIYDIIEQNIFKIIFIIIIIILLTYRYFQYKSIKNNIQNNLQIEHKRIIEEKFNNKIFNQKLNTISPKSNNSINSTNSINLNDSNNLIKNNIPNNNIYTTYNSNNLGNYESW